MTLSALPTKRRYTVTDLVLRLDELHACVHQGNEEVRNVRHELRNHRMEVEHQFGQVRERVAKIEGRQEAVVQRLGVDESRVVQKPAWFPKPWQVVGGVCGGIGGFLALYKVLAAIAPALHHALLAAG